VNVSLILLKYRSRTDIIETILRVTVEGATKTRIMYGAYLSYAQVKEYLSFLIGKNLVFYEEGTAIYKVTPDGMNLLRTFEGISEMISVSVDAKKTVDSLGPGKSERNWIY
jgi:predicted transcriptional regulator